MPSENNVSRVEIEMNLRWADANPSLFVQQFARFQRERPASKWQHRIDLSRDGYVILTADRKAPEFSQEDIWHEMRHLGCTEEQAIRSLREQEARLDD